MLKMSFKALVERVSLPVGCESGVVLHVEVRAVRWNLQTGVGRFRSISNAGQEVSMSLQSHTVPPRS